MCEAGLSGRTCDSWYTHGVTSLFGAAGVRGRELEGEGGPSCMSFTELLRFRELAAFGAYEGTLPPCNELVSDPVLLADFVKPVYSSPKKPCSFLWNFPPALDLEPVEETVVALAIEGRRSSPSGNLIPLPGAKPGDICPRLSEESL